MDDGRVTKMSEALRDDSPVRLRLIFDVGFYPLPWRSGICQVTRLAFWRGP